MGPYFIKRFSDFDLSEVEYWRCSNCGFSASKTHFEMSGDEWAGLNRQFHAASHARDDNPYNRQQRYFNQAVMLKLVAEKSLLKDRSWLDWGAGTGQLSYLLDTYFGLRLSTYDRYFPSPVNSAPASSLRKREWDLVTSTGVFEHVRDRETLDEIESLVSDQGALAIHTLVPERIPQDPEWMYLLPVHCAFHTNRSMQILMDQWGYTSSVYNPDAKMWIWFRREGVGDQVDLINRDLGWEYLHYKKGFVDYWK